MNIQKKTYLLLSVLFFQETPYAVQAADAHQNSYLAPLSDLRVSYTPSSDDYRSLRMTTESETKISNFLKANLKKSDFTQAEEIAFYSGIIQKSVIGKGPDFPFHISIKSKSETPTITDEMLLKIVSKTSFTPTDIKRYKSFLAISVEPNMSALTPQEQNIFNAVMEGIKPHISLVKISSDREKIKRLTIKNFTKISGESIAIKIETILENKNLQIMEGVAEIRELFKDSQSEIDKKIIGYLSHNLSLKDIMNKKINYFDLKYGLILDYFDLWILESFMISFNNKTMDLYPLQGKKRSAHLDCFKNANTFHVAVGEPCVNRSNLKESNNPRALLNEIMIAFFDTT